MSLDTARRFLLNDLIYDLAVFRPLPPHYIPCYIACTCVCVCVCVHTRVCVCINARV